MTGPDAETRFGFCIARGDPQTRWSQWKLSPNIVPLGLVFPWKKNDNKKKQQQRQSLQSSQCAWWREPTDCGSTRTLLCLLVILVPCIFWQVQGWFYFRTSPHVQALVTKVSFSLSANTRTFSNSDDIRLRKNIAKKNNKTRICHNSKTDSELS